MERTFFDYKNSKWVSDVTQASRFKTEQAAANVIAGTAPLTALGDSIMPIDEEKLKEVCSVMSQEEAEQAYEELRQAAYRLGEVSKKLLALRIYYRDVEENEEKLQIDILHKFEFMKSDWLTYVQLGRKMKESRRKRREAKDRLDFLGAIDRASVPTLTYCLDHYEEHLKVRKYVPRIAPDLFSEEEVAK